ncbi:cupin domain-containing protein [Winogradskyella sp. UBA3174]|uniref:cupin domain-containing protein n=1 Tax=Winogradskyella sp. UBA3174 TaxID=1947785 RepID=UPI0025DF82DC|nr:cupin domain-containing protein [Winogradskyella sp. UBA3174]|tara:strand:+ start:29985 stop:30278 length:294 start_codon:yes stop_codon:yes gene_type:complete
MYTINNEINETHFNALQAGKFLDINAKEILLISLEKGSVFPRHTSPRATHLLVLEGSISFHINNEVYPLKTHQVFDFPKDEEHWVETNENSKFIIIR